MKKTSPAYHTLILVTGGELCLIHQRTKEHGKTLATTDVHTLHKSKNMLLILVLSLSICFPLFSGNTYIHK